MKNFLFLFATGVLVNFTACGIVKVNDPDTKNTASESKPENQNSPLRFEDSGFKEEELVVRARTEVSIQVGPSHSFFSMVNSENFVDGTFKVNEKSEDVNVSTSIQASTQFELSQSLFVVPSIATPFEVNDFGFIEINKLKDNRLNLCGISSTQHCGVAMIRVYTTGTAGSGLWNSIDAFGAPIKAGKSTLSEVGLNTSGAIILDQVAISEGQHVLQLKDFVQPKYGINVDFSNAGEGTYSTTLVFEYVLAP